jgi:hypothetical protein
VSTILKALRRLEQERTKDAERPLREEVTLARARRRGPWAAWLATGAALALGFAATWAVLGSLGEPPAEPAAVSAPPVVSGASAPSTPQPVAPATTSPAPTPTVHVAAGAPAGMAAAPHAFAPVPEPAPVSPPTRIAPAALTPPRVAAARPVIEAPPVAEPEPERIYADEDPVVTAPNAGRASRIVDDEPPRSARADVPVDVVRTSWHPQPDRRAAWIAIGGESPREVREGEWVGAYEVRAIEPDGVLFADGPLLVHRGVGQR